MKKITFIILVLSSILFYLSCSVENDKTLSNSLNELRVNLESGHQIEKTYPFSERKFEQYLNDKWIGHAVSYGCYRKGQAPGVIGPSKEEILEDLKIISRYWNLIRVYNADDDSERILEVIRKHGLPIKMMLGVWLAKEAEDPSVKEANITNVLRSIELANKYQDIIAAVNVGNETQVFWSGHKMETENLIRYIRAVRNNSDVPVTTADDYNFWNKPESKDVVEEIDFIVTHIYPLWNGKTLDNAFEWLDENYQDLIKKHPEKLLVLGEIGWATKYDPDKKGPGEQGTLIKGEVSLGAQEKFLTGLDIWIRKNQVVTFLFEAFDEPWKGGGDHTGPDEIEKNWGVFYENRKPKESFESYLNNQDNPKGYFRKEDK